MTDAHRQIDAALAAAKAEAEAEAAHDTRTWARSEIQTARSKIPLADRDAHNALMMMTKKAEREGRVFEDLRAQLNTTKPGHQGWRLHKHEAAILAAYASELDSPHGPGAQAGAQHHTAALGIMDKLMSTKALPDYPDTLGVMVEEYIPAWARRAIELNKRGEIRPLADSGLTQTEADRQRAYWRRYSQWAQRVLEAEATGAPWPKQSRDDHAHWPALRQPGRDEYRNA